jgi:lipopolysaccharide transport system ATP-binding protein
MSSEHRGESSVLKRLEKRKAPSRDVVIDVRNLGKSYRILHQVEKATTMGEAVVSRLKRGRGSEREDFAALTDVSFQVRSGEAVGIIGRNGAGKSTLLKLLTRITAPTTGEIDIRGRLGSLLEVGTGFHPELTGRENIYLNGSILGMRKAEIEAAFDGIVEFSGTGRFLDTPVKRYSSGMSVRLAFAVAAHLSSEILLMDEVLAVGDNDFRAKSLDKMRNLGRDGRTVLFVSHHMPSVLELCSRAIVLEAGRVTFDGPAEAAARHYANSASQAQTLGIAAPEYRDRRPGSGECRLSCFEPEKEIFLSYEPKKFRVEIKSFSEIPLPYTIEAYVYDENKELLLHCDSKLLGTSLDTSEDYAGTFSIGHPWLRPGRYSVTVCLRNPEVIDDVIDACSFEVGEELPFPVPDTGWSSVGRVVSDFRWDVERTN